MLGLRFINHPDLSKEIRVMSLPSSSVDSLTEATRGRETFSRHGNAKGAAGYIDEAALPESSFLGVPGESESFSPPENGFGKIIIGAAWDPLILPDTSFFGRLLKLKKQHDIDVDLGCFYELQNGTRGILQAFGDEYGNVDTPPYIALSGDERTGEAEGDDEFLTINGTKWPDIKRMIIYVYIYQGAPHWGVIKPRLVVTIPDHPKMVISPQAHNETMNVCAIAGLTNHRNGIRLENFTEYFPGHAEMDRAFGFGLQWDDGQKGR